MSRNKRPESREYTLPDGRQLYPINKAFAKPGQAVYQTVDGLAVIASMDQTKHGELLHVSMSYSSRLPSWDDIKAVRDTFFTGDYDAMMMLPRKADYVNYHPFTMHIWECPKGWEIQ